MAEDRLASAKEENAKLRETLTSKDREIFLLKVRFVCRSIRSLPPIRAAPWVVLPSNAAEPAAG